MKSLLLLCMLSLYTVSFGQTKPTTASQSFTIHNDALLRKAMAGLEPNKVRETYGSLFKVKQVTRNAYEPAVKDTVLSVDTNTDKILLFKNKYNSFVTQARITSPKILFGPKIRIGSTKQAFCQAFHLNPKYSRYRIADLADAAVLEFSFTGNTLRLVTYQINYLD